MKVSSPFIRLDFECINMSLFILHYIQTCFVGDVQCPQQKDCIYNHFQLQEELKFDTQNLILILKSSSLFK